MGLRSGHYIHIGLIFLTNDSLEFIAEKMIDEQMLHKPVCDGKYGLIFFQLCGVAIDFAVEGQHHGSHHIAGGFGQHA